MACYCGQGASFAECCEPFLKGEKKPTTAEQLMRARYSAYVTGDLNYIKNTLAPEQRKSFDMAGTKQWAEQSKWLGLQILSVKDGRATDKKGTVEFTAKYEANGKVLEHHEVSQFRRDVDQDRWYFVDGDAHVHEDGQGHHHAPIQTVVRESPKIGRNDPCPCGSGKKYKKCCGQNAT